MFRCVVFVVVCVICWYVLVFNLLCVALRCAGVFEVLCLALFMIVFLCCVLV